MTREAVRYHIVSWDDHTQNFRGRIMTIVVVLHILPTTQINRLLIEFVFLMDNPDPKRTEAIYVKKKRVIPN
jgi:hypothetical protein